MADGCLLLVDAVEGPMPQTRTVLQRALELGLRPIVVVNKIDRPAPAPDEVDRADPGSLPRAGHRRRPARLPGPLRHRPRGPRRADRPTSWPPTCARSSRRSCARCRRRPSTPTAPAQLLVASLDYDPHRGRIAIGRVHRGTIRAGDTLVQHRRRRRARRAQRVTALATFDGLRPAGGRARRAPATSSPSAGFADAKIGATLADPERARGAAGDRDRGADAQADLRRQHLALRRPRGAVLDLPPAARAALPRAGDEPLPARRADRASRMSSPSPVAASCTSRS